MPRYTDDSRTIIADNWTDDGGTFIPVNPLNKDYRKLQALGVQIGDPMRPTPTADDVRAEAYRRITDFMPDWRQRNALARSQELQELREERALTVDEDAEAQTIHAAWEWIKSVRAASNILEPDPPADYRDDIHWPAMPTPR